MKILTIPIVIILSVFILLLGCVNDRQINNANLKTIAIGKYFGKPYSLTSSFMPILTLEANSQFKFELGIGISIIGTYKVDNNKLFLTSSVRGESYVFGITEHTLIIEQQIPGYVINNTEFALAMPSSEKQDTVTQNVYIGQEKMLLDYFNRKFPNSAVTDKCLVDVDNDGFEELLVALNTYSGINKTQEEEARKNGFDMRYVGIISPKGENPIESVQILGKTVAKGMRFEGSDLFIVETKDKKTDQVMVKMKNQNGKEDYFTVKITLNKDGTRVIQ